MSTTTKIYVRRTLLGRQVGRFHRLGQDLDGQHARILERNFLRVVLFQDTLRRRVVGADTVRLPAKVITRRIRVIQLEPVVHVPARIQK